MSILLAGLQPRCRHPSPAQTVCSYYKNVRLVLSCLSYDVVAFLGELSQAVEERLRSQFQRQKRCRGSERSHAVDENVGQHIRRAVNTIRLVCGMGE